MRIKKIICFALAWMLITQCLVEFQGFIQPVSAEETNNLSRMLKVSGNKIVLAEDEETEVILSGVNVPGSEWMHNPDHEFVMRSVKEAMNNWNCNIIRLGVGTKGWYGEKMGNYQPQDGGAFYRNYIDNVINEISKAGKYVILDLHEYEIFYAKQRDFWAEAAQKYKNNPAVLFGLLNEPVGTSWDVWRNGDGQERIGHQEIVELIRGIGAKNILVAGGISWSSDLRGLVGQAPDDATIYALTDQGPNGDITKKGNGIMYDLHMYPWHGGTNRWDINAGKARRQYPLLMGEFGWDEATISSVGNQTFLPGHQQYHDKWMPEIFEWMNDVDRYGNYMNWTAWCFHPSASPRMLEKEGWSDPNYPYTPTDYFGVYVKEELKNRLGRNVALNKAAISSTSPAENPPSHALDGNQDTFWFSSLVGEKYLQVDLGEAFLIDRWIVTHSPLATTRTFSFKLQTSMDGISWTEADSVTNNLASLTDRFFRPTVAKYVRLSVLSGSPSGGNTARIHELQIIGKDARQLPPIPTPQNVYQGGPILVTKQERDFTKGDTLACWYAVNTISYPLGEAEDGISPVMRLTGGTNASQYSNFGLTGELNDFRNVEKWHFRMRSTTDIKIRFTVHYRISEVQMTTNTITLPSTNGEWADFYMDIDDLMPTPQDTWVREMYTQYKTITSTTGNYEPVVQMFVQSIVGSNYADFSIIRSLQYQYGFYVSSLEFSNGGIICNDGLKAGKTDISLRLYNMDITYANNVVLYAAMYQKDTSKLVSSGLKIFSIAPNVQSQAHKVSVTMPDGGLAEDYDVKVFVWQNTDTLKPISHSLTLNDSGVIY